MEYVGQMKKTKKICIIEFLINWLMLIYVNPNKPKSLEDREFRIHFKYKFKFKF